MDEIFSSEPPISRRLKPATKNTEPKPKRKYTRRAIPETETRPVPVEETGGGKF